MICGNFDAATSNLVYRSSSYITRFFEDCELDLRHDGSTRGRTAPQREWTRLVGELSALNMITSLDRAALATYCGAYTLWAEATEAIQKFGAMVKSPTGYPMQSPYSSIANRQAEMMIRIASEFGFTPASRSRIAVPDEPFPAVRSTNHCTSAWEMAI
ncbi:phage terminase small subunit P27 family [Tardiphaga sp.]|uniref:phage terminase small subunit P27 family n=1 Tax=Tardiphaga sp. TaxID=1926292 RepID=UPI002615058D|nr:phage terminase small subunit P27 family [Tardiphaga sp.]